MFVRTAEAVRLRGRGFMPHTSEGVHTAPLSQRSGGICFSHAAYPRVLRSTLKGL